jgi:hypothetical protein
MKKRNLQLPEGTPILDASADDFKEQLEFNLWSTQSSSDYRNDRDRPYNGQPRTDQGVRGKMEVSGLTMRDIADCIVMAMLESAPHPQEYWDRFTEFFNDPEKLKSEQDKFPMCKVELGTWRYQDVYKLDWSNIDPLAIVKNATCRIEKMMGIFPNTQTPTT